MNADRPRVLVRTTTPEDFAGITALCRAVYPESPPWQEAQLESHQRVFPAGQFVALDRATGRVAGMAASLVVHWADYRMDGSWRDFTDRGYFTNHDPAGRTLYGAEVLVDPAVQRLGIGSRLYAARFDLVRRLGLRRIRAAARLRGYHRHAARLDAADYVIRVLRGELRDPTLSFQLRHGFEVIAVVSGYLRHDPESLGHAAVIEWLNPAVTSPDAGADRDPRFVTPRAGPRD